MKLVYIMALPWETAINFCVKFLEDEYYFLWSCDFYGNLRNSPYTNIISVYPQFQDLNSNENFIYIIKKLPDTGC